jgi:disulfide bond formation protein DsbB
MTAITSSTETMNTNRANLIIFLQDYGVQLAFGPALAALLGSLYFSEFAGFEPCKLCWIQRILMYPLTIILLVGIFNHDDVIPKYVLPFSISGMGVSLYHYLLQNHVFGEQSNFCAVGVSCVSRYINLAGFITIPFLALIAFTMITALLIGFAWANRYEVEEDDEEEN